jgi:ATP-dependent Clp protease ATP-binding subunit ClpC
MMFERYTELARRALFFARYEASRLGASSIETEHLLLGLLRESGPIIGPILLRAEVDERVRSQINDLIKTGPKLPTSVEMPFSDAMKRVLHDAAEEADGLGHRHVGVEHLLLGLLRQPGTFAERALADRGLFVDSMRKEIRDDAAASIDESASSPPSRVEAIMAAQRASSLLATMGQSVDPRFQELVESIQFDLDLVRRALIERA